MALKITTRQVGDVSVVSIDGRIVLGEESNNFAIRSEHSCQKIRPKSSWI